MNVGLPSSYFIECAFRVLGWRKNACDVCFCGERESHQGKQNDMQIRTRTGQQVRHNATAHTQRNAKQDRHVVVSLRAVFSWGFFFAKKRDGQQIKQLGEAERERVLTVFYVGRF
jgi:hypothetical protein